MKAKLVFHAGYRDADEVVVTFDVPSTEPSRSVDGITAAMIAFVQRHIAALHPR